MNYHVGGVACMLERHCGLAGACIMLAYGCDVPTTIGWRWICAVLRHFQLIFDTVTSDHRL